MLRAAPLAVLAALAAALALTGCGLGAGTAPHHVTLTVTRDFGAKPVTSGHALRVQGEETVMSLLMRNYAVSTRYGGGFVESIDGFSGGHRNGDPVDWFYYVNGVEAAAGAAQTTVHRGDAIWWDLHDWSQTAYTPAVVGSFPEPFLHGVEGRRMPVRIECAEPAGYACRTVSGELHALGVSATAAPLRASAMAPHTLRVAVGRWPAVRALAAAQALLGGPAASGVYARMGASGRSLALLDERGGVTRTLGAGSGLVAALRRPGEEPVWVVTGTDTAGVDRAAHALEPVTLHDRFAVALSPGGGALALPQEARGSNAAQ